MSRTRVAIHGGVATLAAATALSAVFDGYSWFWPVAGGVAIVVAVGELVRRSPLPAALGPLLAAAGVLCYLTALYAGDAAWGGVVPTHAALTELGDVARSGFTDIRKLAPPVPAHDGLVLLTIVGVAAIGLVVDLFAVTLRRAALAGLPLLAVFATGTSISKHGSGWFPFVLATTGYLWLLLADSRYRLTRWGRSLGFDRDARPRFSWSDEEVAPSPLSVMGRRIGVLAVGVGVVLPMLVPGLRGGVPHGHGNGFGFGGGSSEAVTVNPIVTIRAQLQSGRSQPLLSVSTTDTSPGYLRLTALDHFDGEQFSPGTLEQPASAQVSRGLSAPPVAGVEARATISVQSLAVHWLPVPVQVESVQVDGDWRYDPPTNTVFSARTDTRGLHYSVQSVRPNPSPQQLESLDSVDPAVESDLALPHLPPTISALATKITSKASSPFEKAVALQQFFQSPPFTYDESVQSNDSTTALTDFLFHSHRGFCQQYASAMAVLARTIGIPSRIAVGFTHGTKQPDGTWLITTRDAHAWPELYFSGYGWLAFEPTPRGDGQASPPAYTLIGTTKGGNNQGGQGSGRNNTTPRALPGGFKHDKVNEPAGGGAPAVATRTNTHGVSLRKLVALALLALVTLLLVIPSIARVIGRRRRWRDADTPAEQAFAAWSELRACALDARVPWVDRLSPRATARLVRTEAGGLATAELRALDRVVAAVERATYAADTRGIRTDDLRDDVEEIRAALLAESTAGERFVMRAWPRSTLRAARESLGRAGELLDRVDLAATRLRVRLRPRHS